MIGVAEKHGFWSSGYLIVKGALSQASCDAASRQVWSMFSRGNSDRVGEFKEWNIVAKDEIFLQIAANPAVVDVIEDLFVTPIRLMYSRLSLRFPGSGPGTWHADGGRLPDGSNGYSSCIEPGSLLQLTVIYALNDLVAPESGMTVVVPGSHRLPNSDASYYQGDREPIGSSSPPMERGDALLVHQSLWHRAGSVNHDVPRELLLYSYCHRWQQPFDYDTSQLINDRGNLTPRQRALLDPVPQGAGSGDYYRSGEYR